MLNVIRKRPAVRYFRHAKDTMRAVVARFLGGGRSSLSVYFPLVFLFSRVRSSIYWTTAYNRCRGFRPLILLLASADRRLRNRWTGFPTSLPLSVR